MCTTPGVIPFIDGGSVHKSWVKDKNTIVIEKQPLFDENGPLIIYIVTLYP